MLFTTKGSPRMRLQVAFYLSVYGISFEEFVRASTDFVQLYYALPKASIDERMAALVAKRKVSKPTETGESVEEDQLEPITTSDTPTFASDFYELLLPQSRLIPEIHRISALLEDTMLVIRSQRLEVESFIRSKGASPSFASKRSALLKNPLALKSGTDMPTLDELAQLSRLEGASFDGHPLFHTTAATTTLSFGGTEPDQGIRMTQSDLLMLYPYLSYYHYADDVTLNGNILTHSQVTSLMPGVCNFLFQMLEVVCFGLAINQGLSQQDLRQDLFQIHYRSQRIFQAYEAILLQTEVQLHTLKSYSDLARRALSILASGVTRNSAVYPGAEFIPTLEAIRQGANKPTDATKITKETIAAFQAGVF